MYAKFNKKFNIISLRKKCLERVIKIMEFSVNYQIRICKESEYGLLVDFIAKHWNANHIFTKSKKMLDFQHLDRENKNYNFIVAFNKKNKEFDAILGFIPLSLYDKNLTNNEFWLAIWKVVDSSNSSIGLQILLYFIQKYKPRSLGIIGASQMALKIYKAFKYHTGKLEHFYIKNNQYQNYTLAKFTQRIPQIQKGNFTIVPLRDLENITIESFLSPYKSLRFFKNKYAKHPFYKYEFYAINQMQSCVGVFVLRQVFNEGASCLRVIDWLGDFPRNLYDEFQKILISKNSEYLDLLCYLKDEDKITQMGFCKKQSNEIVPNYFEPFENRNVDMHFAYKTFDKMPDYAFFKGDSDQDRPNLIKEQ